MNSYWVRGDDGEAYGPCSKNELREWIGESRLGLDSPVRLDEAASEWMPLQDYPELVVLVAESEVRNQRQDVIAGAPLAGFGRRILACLVDLMILSILSAIVWVTTILVGLITVKDLYELAERIQADGYNTLPTYVYVILALSSAINVAYMTFFIGRDGQTPGMQLFALRAVNADGLTVNFGQALIRAVFFELTCAFWGIGFLAALITPKRQTLHDLIASTYVIQLPKRP